MTAPPTQNPTPTPTPPSPGPPQPTPPASEGFVGFIKLHGGQVLAAVTVLGGLSMVYAAGQIEERITTAERRVTDRMELRFGEAGRRLDRIEGKLWPTGIGDAGEPDAPLVPTDGSTASRRVHHYWCEFDRITRHGWNGIDATLDDGTHLYFLFFPGRGLVRVGRDDVPDAMAPARELAFRTERTEWGWAADVGGGHMGQWASLGSERYCYEFRDGDLQGMTCSDAGNP